MSAGQWMLKEIREAPDAVSRVRSREATRAGRLGAALRRRGATAVVVVGRGTSDNAAVLAKYLFEWSLGLPVSLAAPSLATLYGGALRLRGAVVVALSQSGRSEDVVAYLTRARRSGAAAVAVTGDPRSPLARAADEVLELHAGRERSVAATKTFAAELACLYLLASRWAEGEPANRLAKGLAAAPGLLEKTLALEPAARAGVLSRPPMDRCVVLGRGFGFPAALETALKLKESAGIFAEGASAADFMHGPVSMAAPGLSAWVLAPRGPALTSLKRAARALRRAGADVAVFTADRGLLRAASWGLALPGPLDEVFSPLVLSALGQLAACHLALAQGRDPDRPRGLRKVTETW